MKVRELSMVYLDDYLTLEGENHNKVKTYLSGAINYCMNITGLTKEEVEECEHLTDFILIYIQQMYDNGFVDFNSTVREFATMDRRLEYEM